MAKLGFLGLGIMGGPMARRLMEAGHHVALWSKSPGKAERFAAYGGIACETPKDVARQSEIVFLCVGNTTMSRLAILGEGGLAEGASKGLVIADCSLEENGICIRARETRFLIPATVRWD